MFTVIGVSLATGRKYALGQFVARDAARALAKFVTTESRIAAWPVPMRAWVRNP